MNIPHGFTFNDQTTTPQPIEPDGIIQTDEDTNEPGDEITITDPDTIKQIETQIIHHETRNGKDALIIDETALADILYPDDLMGGELDDGYGDDYDDDEYDEDDSQDFAVIWNNTNWDDPNDILPRAAFLSDSLTQAFWQLQDDFAPHGDDCDFSTGEAVTAIAAMLAMDNAASARLATFLACGHYHVSNFHSKKDRIAWEERIGRIYANTSWDAIIMQYPAIPKLEQAFDRLNASGMNQLVAINDTGLAVRLRPVDDDGGFDVDIITDNGDDDEDGDE